MSYDPYENNDYFSPSAPKKLNRVEKGMILGLIGALVAAYPTTIPWVISAVVFWLFMFVTNMINFFVAAGVLQLAWYVVLIAVPFFGIAMPFFLAVIAYEEGRSKLAMRRPELAIGFSEIPLFISNNTVMVVVEISVIVLAVFGAFGNYTASNIGSAGVMFAISVISPLLCYVSSRLIAASIK